MKVILIQGKENTGKTTLCKKIEKWLINYFIISRGGLKLERQLNYSNKRCNDFLGVYENENNRYESSKRECEALKVYKRSDYNEEDGRIKKVIINSASDDDYVICCFKDFFGKNKNNCNVLITAIRPLGKSQGGKCGCNNEKKEDSKKNSLHCGIKCAIEETMKPIKINYETTINLDDLKSKYSSDTFIEDVFLNEFIPRFFK